MTLADGSIGVPPVFCSRSPPQGCQAQDKEGCFSFAASFGLPARPDRIGPYPGVFWRIADWLEAV